jgi:hypothetical protein
MTDYKSMFEQAVRTLAALKRLMELGVVRSLGFGRCATTAFGDWLVEQHFEQAPTLPLKTEDDYSKTPNAGVKAAAEGSPATEGSEP